MDTTCNLACWRIETALRLEPAVLTVHLAGVIEVGFSLSNVCAWVCEGIPLLSQCLAIRAEVLICFWLPNKVACGKCAVESLASISYWNLRLDSFVFDQPAEHGGSTICRITDEPVWLEMQALLDAVNHDAGGL